MISLEEEIVVSETPPNVYDGIGDLTGGSLVVPSITDPTFVEAYENTYGTLYRRLLSSLGYPSPPGLDFRREQCDALAHYLADQHRQLKAFLFAREPATFGNPLLIGCGSVQKLIADWLHDSDDCLFSSNGLMYPTPEALQSHGPPKPPATAMFAWQANLLRGESTTFEYGLSDPMAGVDPMQRVTEAPPENLFRGQQGTWQPLAPFVRPLIDSSTEAEARREQVRFHVDEELLAHADHSLLATVNQALAIASVLCHHFPESTKDTLVPTPYNLLWRYGPWEREAVLRLCGEVFDVSIFLCTANLGSEEELAIFFSHLTDYAYPVPVHANVQFVTDLVPNPLVSTTTDISRALLYASGYFAEFADKFEVDWDKVETRVEAGPGYVLLIRVPSSGPGARRVVPISKIADFLPPPYRSVGMLEGEYGVTASVRPEEIASIREAADVLSRLKARGLWQELSRDPNAVTTEAVVSVAFN